MSLLLPFLSGFHSFELIVRGMSEILLLMNKLGLRSKCSFSTQGCVVSCSQTVPPQDTPHAWTHTEVLAYQRLNNVHLYSSVYSLYMCVHILESPPDGLHIVKESTAKVA